MDMITLSRPRCAVSRLAVVGGVREGLGVALVPVDFVVEPESAFATAAAESTGMVTVAGFNVSIAASVAPVVSAGVSRRQWRASMRVPRRVASWTLHHVH